MRAMASASSTSIRRPRGPIGLRGALTGPLPSAAAPTSRLASSTAPIASSEYPSAPISFAHEPVTGAPPTITLSGGRRPASVSAAITVRWPVIVVVRSAERPTMSARCSRAAATKRSGETLTPRS